MASYVSSRDTPQQQQQPAIPKSPTLSLKAGNTPSLAALGGGDVAGARTPLDVTRDPHLDATEPRYFPGVITRSQRRNSKRQDSMHESDEGSGRKGGGGG